MDIFKELPFELQSVIYGKYQKEKYLQKLEALQHDNYVEVMDQFNTYKTAFYHKAQDCWCWDLLFFTIRYEKTMNHYTVDMPTFI